MSSTALATDSSVLEMTVDIYLYDWIINLKQLQLI